MGSFLALLEAQMRQLLPALGSTLILLLVQTVPATTQQETTTLGEEEATIVHSTDGVQVLKMRGTEINARNQNFPGTYLQWYVVQDSSLGLVFREPSGLKIDNERDYDADIDLRALEGVEAIEVRAFTFNVWDEYVGSYRTTYRVNLAAEDEVSFDPRWYDLRDEDHRHLTSVIFISRVRHPDGSITEANTEPVHHVAQEIDDSFTPGADEEDMEELLELWRKFLRQLQGSPLPGSVTLEDDVPEGG